MILREILDTVMEKDIFILLHSEPLQVHISVKFNKYKYGQGFLGDLHWREHFHAGQDLKCSD